MTATWTRLETGVVDELLSCYWTRVIVTHLSSYQSLDSVSFIGNNNTGLSVCLSLCRIARVK